MAKIFLCRHKLLLAQIFVACVFVLANTGNTYGFEAYNHSDTINIDKSDWMSRLKDNARLRELSIPGTHDSVARYGGHSFETQSLDLPIQLRAGIRFLDIRLKCKDNSLIGYHGSKSQNINFSQILDVVSNFLRDHPNETVIMRVKNEAERTSTSGKGKVEDPDCKDTSRWTTFYNAFEYYYDSSNLFWRPDQTGDNAVDAVINPQLASIRGRLVVFPDFWGASTRNFGIPWTSGSSKLAIQDTWEQIKTNWDLHDQKWEFAKRHFQAARNQINEPMANRQIYINFLNAPAPAGFPYFFASGKSSPGNGAPRLSTGLVRCINDLRIYPDFPRASCALALSCGKSSATKKRCTILFEGVNELSRNWLNSPSNYTDYAGIVVMDFPGKDLINNIIGVNDHRLLR